MSAKVQTIIELAEDCGAADKPIDGALAAMVRHLNQNPDLRERLLGAMIRKACLSAIYAVRNSARTEIKFGRAPWNSNPQTRQEVADVMAKSILDSWPIEAFEDGDGFVLGDGTREQLGKLAELERKKARGHMLVVRFFMSLRAEMTDGHRVRDCVDAERASLIWERVKSGTPAPGLALQAH